MAMSAHRWWDDAPTTDAREEERWVRAVENILDANCADCVALEPRGVVCQRHQQLFHQVSLQGLRLARKPSHKEDL